MLMIWKKFQTRYIKRKSHIFVQSCRSLIGEISGNIRKSHIFVQSCRSQYKGEMHGRTEPFYGKSGLVWLAMVRVGEQKYISCHTSRFDLDKEKHYFTATSRFLTTKLDNLENKC